MLQATEVGDLLALHVEDEHAGGELGLGQLALGLLQSGAEGGLQVLVGDGDGPRRADGAVPYDRRQKHRKPANHEMPSHDSFLTNWLPCYFFPPDGCVGAGASRTSKESKNLGIAGE